MEWVIGAILFFVAISFTIAILRWIFDVPNYFNKCARELESISGSLCALVEVERERLRLERDKYKKDSTRSGL